MDELLDALKPISDIITDVERHSETPIACGDRDTIYRVPISRGELRDIYGAVLNAQAEIAQLREQLADAYAIEQLDWAVTTNDDGSRHASCIKAGIKLTVYHLEDTGWEWFGHTGGTSDGVSASDIADGQAKAEAWRRERMRMGWRKIVCVI